MQGLFAYGKVVQQWCSTSGILDNIRLQMNPFASRIVHGGDLNVAHLEGPSVPSTNALGHIGAFSRSAASSNAASPRHPLQRW